MVSNSFKTFNNNLDHPEAHAIISSSSGIPDKWSKRRWGALLFFFCTFIPLLPVNPTPPPQITPPPAIPPTKDPLLQQQSPIPAELDGPYQVWKEKEKYFLVMTVDESALKGTGLDFSRVDGTKVSRVLSHLGYTSLLPHSQFLAGEQTNRSMVVSALKGMKILPAPATVIVYYSGHGITSDQPPNVWLQLSGQDKAGPDQGISLNEVLKIPRMAGYHGDLIVIVDAAYSGEAPFSQALNFKDLHNNSVILTSSGTEQHSQTLRTPVGKISAFTHTLLEALSSEWSNADENRDGILRISELKHFIRMKLNRYFQHKDIPEFMKPEMIIPQNPEHVLLAYRRNRVQHWTTDDRQALQILALEHALSPSIRREKILEKTSSGKLGVSQRAKFLAQHVSNRTRDLYVEGLLALTEENLTEARRLLSQAYKTEKDNPPRLRKIFLAKGRTEIYAGRITLALVWYKKSLALQPPIDAKLLNEFGLVWVQNGLYEEALPFFQQALTIREDTLDPMDPNLAVNLNNLAGLYHKQRKYVEAEPLYRRALQITENAVGPEDPSLVVQLNNLAKLYLEQQKYLEAESLYGRALQITERTLGPHHPKVIPALHNLAEVYRVQGKYAQIEPLFQRVVQIEEATFGSTHPKVAFALNNLALIYGAQGKYAKAEPIYHRVVQIDEASLGPLHLEVAIDLNNLAELYRTQGKFEQAEPLYLRSYEIMRHHFGLTHLKTRTVMNNYLLMLHKSGQVEKARRFKEEYQQALRNQSPS